MSGELPFVLARVRVCVYIPLRSHGCARKMTLESFTVTSFLKSHRRLRAGKKKVNTVV
jgi:hypothetical protein